MPELEKVKCSTPDFAEETAKKILVLLPECAGEGGAVDIEKLKQCLSSKVIEGNVERYEFTWPGKRAAKAAASAATTKTLRPCVAESVGRDGTPGGFDSENLYIEGDNLEVLKLLQTSYANQVKMIYIDPPYNTGHDFVYRDRFSLTQKELESEAGVFDEDGNRFEVNDSSEARYHSNWCSMMYPRLKLARNLLRDDGVIFVSLDDSEDGNIKKLLDEVFYEVNFVAKIIVVVKTEGRRYGYFAKTHEYIYVYAKDIEKLALNEIEVEGAKFDYSDSLGGFNLTDLRNQNARYFNSSNRPNLRYPFYVDVSHPTKEGFCAVTTIPTDGYQEVWAITVNGNESVWRWGKETAEKEKHNLTARLSSDGEYRIYQKYRKLTQTAKTTWIDKNFISNHGTKQLQDLLGLGVFDFPKPVELIKRIITIGSNSEDLVLDFFSGSATTAHAVMQLNAEDGGNRKFIMVQLPEPCVEDSEAAKAGYANICEIGKERIRRAGKEIAEELAAKNAEVAKKNEQGELGLENPDNPVNPVEKEIPDIGFRVLKLDTSSLRDTSATVSETNQEFANFERVRSDRSADDLLFQMLLETRIPLSEPICKSKVSGNEVFFVGENTDAQEKDALSGAPLVACLDHGAKMDSEFFIEIAKLKPGIAFFRDDAFADDSARTNLQQVFAQFSPTTSIKVI